MGKRQETARDETRVTVGAKMPVILRRALEEIAREEDRTLSSAVAHILKESPRVKSKLRELAAA